MTGLPVAVQEGLSKYLDSDEVVLFSLRTNRSIYKASSLRESNQYYSTWFVVTSKRAAVLRNGSSLQIFRDILYEQIERVLYETGDKEASLIFEGHDRSDIQEFGVQSVPHFDELKRRLEMARKSPKESPRESNRPSASAHAKNFCSNCGQKLEASPNFCPSCGTKL